MVGKGFPAYVYIYIYTYIYIYIKQRQPKKTNEKPAYNNKIKVDLEKLKNGEAQAAKVDLTKNNIRRLATP